jgi:uncharacterized membrane-anchored protein
MYSSVEGRDPHVWFILLLMSFLSSTLFTKIALALKPYTHTAIGTILISLKVLEVEVMNIS